MDFPIFGAFCTIKFHCTKFWIVLTLYHFLKVTAVKVALSSGSQKPESAISKPLKEQAFATPEKIAELVQKVYMQIHSVFESNNVVNFVEGI